MPLERLEIGRIIYSISGMDNSGFYKFPVWSDITGSPETVSACRLSLFRHETKLDVQQLQGGVRSLFEADATWGLYAAQTGHTKRDTKYILTVPSLRNSRRPQLFAAFDKAFKHGRVHIGKTGAHDFLYPFLEVLTINLLGMGNGVLLHACCVDDNGKGYLFVGQSGAGKSTMAGLWNGKKGVRVLSDDRVIVHAAPDTGHGTRFVAYGTPWHGTANYAMNASVPLHKVFLISHSKKNSSVPVKGVRPVTSLIRDSFLPFWDRDKINYSIGFIDRIARNIDLFDLGFVPKEEAVNFIKNM